MLTNLNTPILILSAIAAAFFVAIWFSLIIWTARDIKSRSRDPLLRILSIAAVLVLNLIGFVVYLILRPKFTIAEQFQQSLEEEALLQSLEGASRCRACGRSVKKKWHHCPHCGTQLKNKCSTCHSLVELDWKHCPFCGAPTSDPTDETQHKTDAPAEDEDNDVIFSESENEHYATTSHTEELVEDTDIENL